MNLNVFHLPIFLLHISLMCYLLTCTSIFPLRLIVPFYISDSLQANMSCVSFVSLCSSQLLLPSQTLN